MLKHLHIKNLAIIDELDLDFGGGFTVLTGETGAGKSILIDAIGLAIGTRADAALVRAGQDKAEIAAEFALAGAPAARAWLAETELADAEDPELCVIRRVVHAEGRTRAFVNGSPVNAGQLRELGEMLIEIFGQSESQTLLRPDVQRTLLDGYGGYGAALDAVAAAAREWSDADHAIARLRQGAPLDPAQLDYLRFQLRELEALNLGEQELEELEAEHTRLANAGRLLQDGGRAQEQLYGGDATLYDRLAEITSLLDALVPLHEGFRPAQALVESAQANVREAADTIRHVLDRMDLDPEHLAELEKRLGAIHDLARKHRVRAAELPAHLAGLRARIAELEQSAGSLDQMEQRRERALEAWRKAAARLSTERRKTARGFAEGVTAIVRQLGMPNAQFQVALEAAASERPRAHGDDDITFNFSANPGQPPRALAKVASGGELSRVSLAIQVTSQQKSGAGTMIFDEVDAGIGGGVAEIVGAQLRALGARRQVLCVTHLAQVAAQGHQHCAIGKEVKAGQTYTRVRPLAQAERVEELARMQGGVEISAAAMSHARDLLKRASKS